MIDMNELSHTSLLPSSVDGSADDEQSQQQEGQQQERNHLLKKQISVGIFLAVGALFVVVVIIAHNSSHYSPPPLFPPPCAVFCSGPILQAVQASGIFNDSKHFVDMPLLVSVEEVQRRFAALPLPHTKTSLTQFVSMYFGEPGSDLEAWNTTDWQPMPPKLAAITNTTFRDWALALNNMWPVLGRKPKNSVYSNPTRHSLIGTTGGIIIPGGRFREIYYWDTLWIVKGLMACDMRQTAWTVIQNLLDFVHQFGFVPNGSRQYYLTRSQPPMLPSMVDLLAPSDTELATVIDALDIEYAWFMDEAHGHYVPQYGLNRFSAQTAAPRPESWVEDTATAAQDSTRSAEDIFSDLVAGAETGWDYSSRWFANRMNQTTIDTRQVLPVDLNVIMHRNEALLASFHRRLGNKNEATKYEAAKQQREENIQTHLWDASTAQWKDFNLRTKRKAPTGVLSNYFGLWTRWSDKLEANLPFNSIVDSLKASGLVQPAGLATTTTHTMQQWDFPNGWAPLQSILIDALRTRNLDPVFTASLTSRWLETNLVVWKRYQAMVEKYDVQSIGSIGGGGEYELQVGFGWTNGVVLEFLID